MRSMFRVMLLACAGVFVLAGAALADSTTFKVNMKVMKEAGLFDPTKQTMHVRGSFNGWGDGSNLSDANGDLIYEGKFDVGTTSPVKYKFVVKEGSNVTWEDNLSADRELPLTGNPQTLNAVEWTDGVKFSVDMSAPIAQSRFSPATQFVSIAGGFNDWLGTGIGVSNGDSATARKFQLKLDKDNIYVANIPVGALTNKFKFTINNSSNGKIATWEGHSDRSINLTGSTLARPVNVALPWDGDPGVAVTGTLLFQVDITPLKSLGIFNETEGDTLQLRGAFNDWNDAIPARSIMRQSLLNPNVYDLPITETRVPGFKMEYKFFIKFNRNRAIWGGKDPIAGWEEPGSTGGGNRTVTFPGAGNTPLPVQTFNDIFTVVPKDTSITMKFVADMRCFLRNPPQPVSKANDTLRLEIQDDTWHFFNNTLNFNNATKLVGKTPFDFTDANNDSIYELSVTTKGPIQNWVQYHLNWQGLTEKAPGFSLGRRRVRYARPNAQGVFRNKSTFQFGRDYFSTVENPLLIESPNGPTLNDTPPCQNLTSVAQTRAGVPDNYALSQNYPNPFNPSTTIEYALRQNGRVSISLYNSLGQKVADLLNEVQAAGSYKLNVDMSQLKLATSGIYFYQISAGDFKATRRMLYVK